MKRNLLLLSLGLFIAVSCDKSRPDSHSARRTGGARTFSSFDPPTPGEKTTPAHGIKFEQAELTQVLDLYAEVSGRSIIRAGNVPNAKITFSNQTPMTSVEVLQALDTVLAAQGITTVLLGSQYVKVVPAAAAAAESAPVVELEPDQLPDSSSYLTYVARLKNIAPEQAVPTLQPFAKMPNSIIAMKGSDVIILRDYSSNVRLMLKALEEIDHGPGLKKTAEQMLKPGPASPGTSPRR